MNIDAETNVADVQTLLHDLGWEESKKISSLAVAGAGNMNIVLRIKSEQASYILKQSRPYVAKFPSIAAPVERIDVEYAFYQALSTSSLKDHFPTILHYAPNNHLLMMEDLGEIEDMTSIYATRKVDEHILNLLVQIAYQTHTTKVSASFPDNMTLRRLNHQHIFHLPFLGDNGFNLDDVQSGLQELAHQLQYNTSLRSKALHYGDQYLSKGFQLIHGDYYPGSWMTIDDRLYVIDPEFCHLGNAAFDIGVMAAHITMATGDGHMIEHIVDQYPGDLETRLVYAYAGIEIIRRLIGLAQLPLERSIEEKATLLDLAQTWIN